MGVYKSARYSLALVTEYIQFLFRSQKTDDWPVSRVGVNVNTCSRPRGTRHRLHILYVYLNVLYENFKNQKIIYPKIYITGTTQFSPPPPDILPPGHSPPLNTDQFPLPEIRGHFAPRLVDKFPPF
jgi:hypothetical protein